MVHRLNPACCLPAMVLMFLSGWKKIGRRIIFCDVNIIQGFNFSTYKQNLIGSQPHPLIYISSTDGFSLQGQSLSGCDRVASKGLNMLLSCHLQEEFADPCYRTSLPARMEDCDLV